jgi:hypothetical protein
MIDENYASCGGGQLDLTTFIRWKSILRELCTNITVLRTYLLILQENLSDQKENLRQRRRYRHVDLIGNQYLRVIRSPHGGATVDCGAM